MAVRATRQYTEVLTHGEGSICVTRQIVQVLARADVFSFAIDDAVTWIDTAVLTAKSLTVEDTITWTDASRNIEIFKDSSDTFTITDEATVVWSQQFADNTLTWTDEAIGHIAEIFIADASDIIVYTDEATYTIIPDTHFVEDTITFIHTADHSKIGRELEDTIVFSDLATQDNTTKTAEPVDFIEWDHEVEVGGTRSFTVEDQLTDDYVQWDPDTGLGSILHYGLGQRLRYDLIRTSQIQHHIGFDDAISLIHVKASGTSLLAESTITWTDMADRPTESIDDIVLFTDAAEAEVITTFTDTIEWSDLVELEKILSPQVTDAFNITDAVAYTLFSDGSFCAYSPELGSSSDPNAPHPPGPTAPTLVAQDDFHMFYPYSDAPTDTVNIRVPDFGNKYSHASQRIKRETRGGTLVVFASPIWPQNHTMSATFSNLTEVECQEVLDFVDTSLGKLIGIRDWEGQYWVGIITSPDSVIVRDGVAGSSIALTIEMQHLKDYLITSDTIVFTDNTSASIDQFAPDTITWTDTATRQYITNRSTELNFIGWYNVATYQHVANRSITDTVVWTDVATVIYVHCRSLTATVTWTDTATRQFIADRPITDPVVWTDIATREIIVLRTITDPVVWTDTATRQFIRTESETDTITFTDSAIVELVRERYWLGTSVIWTSTVNWSLTSGGSSGVSIPDQYTTAIFDGNGTGNANFQGDVTIKKLNMQSGYTGSIAQSTRILNVEDITLLGTTGTYGITSGTMNVSGNLDFSGLGTFVRGTSTIVMSGTDKTFELNAAKITKDLTIDGTITVLGGGANFTVGGVLEINGTFTVESPRVIILNSTAYNSDLQVNAGGEITGGGTIAIQFALSGLGVSVMDGDYTITQTQIWYSATTAAWAPGFYDTHFNMIQSSGFSNAATVRLSAGAYRFGSLSFTGNSGVGSSITLDCSTNAVTSLQVDGDLSMLGTGTDAHNTLTCSGQSVALTLKSDMIVTVTGISTNTWTKGTGTLALAPTANSAINLNAFSVEAITVTAGASTITFGGIIDTVSYLHSTGTVNFGGYDVSTTNNFTISAGAQTIGSSYNGSAMVIGGNFSVTGQALLELDMHAGSAWTLTITGTAVADYVNVDYSDATLGTNVTATNSTDGGNNSGWSFV